MASAKQSDKNNTAKTEEYNALVDQLKSVDGVSESAAELIAGNWQRLLVIGALILCFVWIFHGYQSRQHDKVQAAAGLFMNLQTKYAEIHKTGINDQNLQELLSTLKVLKESYNGTTYGNLADLYHGLLLNKKTTEELKSLDSDFDIYAKSPLPEGNNIVDQERFLHELVKLADARKLVSERKISEARNALKEIIKAQGFTAVEASILLTRMSLNNAEKEEAKGLTEALIASKPELADLLP